MKYAVPILFLSAAVSMAADDADSKKLLKDLEGTYKVTSAERSGEPLPARFFDAFEKVTIKGDKFSVTVKGEDGKLQTKVTTITVDAAKKPAQFDLKHDDGTKKDEKSLGIIAIDGETIKLCFDDSPNKKRPPEFKTSKDEPYVFLTLKKVKE
jgi:uncharacterized protein (TIGR03067 family)